MPSSKLSPISRPTKPPSLKRRAATLKAGLLRLTARPAIPSPLQTPGSPEAVAAYEAARSEFDRLTSLSEAEYAALRIGDSFTLWTTSGVEAAQRGDFSRFTMREMGAVRSKTPAELADLLVITARRDLQFAEAQRQTGLRILYALAYPNGEDEAPDLDPEGDYAHVIIAEHRAAYAAFKPLNDAWNNAKGREAFDAAERALEEPHRVHAEAYGNLIDTQPSTLAGLVALAGYVPETVHVNNEDDADSDAARALRSICNSVLTLIENGEIAAPPEADPTDWDAPPPGFMAYPEREPMSFVNIKYGLRLEFERLHRIALAEFDRRIALEATAEQFERVRRQLLLPVFEAALPNGDAQILALGLELDAAHAAWRAAEDANREPAERLARALDEIEARADATPEDIRAAWRLPGVNESHKAVEDAFCALDPICEAIWSAPARTAAGLAVKARAALVHTWTGGSFEKDAALGKDEDLQEQVARRLIEACCAFAGVNWKGEPIGGAEEAAGPLSALPRPAGSALPPETIIADRLDLKPMSMSELASIHDVAALITDVANAVSCQPRCASGKPYPAPSYNVVGTLVEWISDALTAVADGAAREMRSRVPTSDFERARRLQVLAQATVANGDPDETRAFVRELLAAVET